MLSGPFFDFGDGFGSSTALKRANGDFLTGAFLRLVNGETLHCLSEYIQREEFKVSSWLAQVKVGGPAVDWGINASGCACPFSISLNGLVELVTGIPKDCTLSLSHGSRVPTGS
jgi:hypothetical protein